MEEKALQNRMAQMTLEEKILQLVQVTGRSFGANGDLQTGPSAALGLKEGQGNLVGSVLSWVGAEKTEDLQKKAAEGKQDPIPLLFMADVINGYRTVFPIPLAQGCSFDPELVKQCARAAAREASWAGIHCVFSPMVDLCRDARWGRCMESTGEDVYLNCRMAEAMVEGYQGENLKEKESVAACVKHFAAYGAATGGREYTGAELSEHSLRQDYLPAYAAGIQSGAAMVMAAFNGLNGVPCTENRPLLTEILREEMGFDGATISDWGAVEELVKIGTCENSAQAAEKALNAGIDIEMMSGAYAGNLEELIRTGKVSQALLDRAVWRVLTLKNRLGLFEDSARGRDAGKDTAPVPENHRRLAETMALESMVLLKNQEELLPLPKAGKKIALIGPYGNTRALNGSWSLFGDERENETLSEAMDRAGIGHTFSQGCPLLSPGTAFPGRTGLCREETTWEECEKMLTQAEQAAHQADVVILALGEHIQQSGEAASSVSLTLPEVQRRLLRRVTAVNPNVVTVVFAGRPLVLEEASRLSRALMLAWLPGRGGAAALEALLFGDASPSGKLSMSAPRAAAQEPIWYSDLKNGRMRHMFPSVRYISGYLDCPDTPLFPFGYGLSYTRFAYGVPQVREEPGMQFVVSCTVTNVGSCKGTEIAQLYLQDPVSSVIRPERELKGFQRLMLEPGQTGVAQFRLGAWELSLVDRHGNRIVEQGAFRVLVGGDSRTENQAEFFCREGKELSRWNMH